MKVRMDLYGAWQLIKDIEAHLPLPVYATTKLARSLRQHGEDVDSPRA